MQAAQPRVDPHPSHRFRALTVLLAITGALISCATIDGWLTGVALDAGPQFRRGDFLRGARAIGAGHAAFWLLCVVAWIRHRPSALFTGVLALLICGIGVVALKQSVQRGRPDRSSSARPVPEVAVKSSSDLSFPSGDTAQAFTQAFVAAAYLPRAWCWVPLAAASLPGFQRVMAGRHFLSDVLAGLALGVLSASAALCLVRRFRARFHVPLRLQRSKALAGLVCSVWGLSWFLEEGVAFASAYVPAIVLGLFLIKGTALERWVRGTILGPRGDGFDPRLRLRALRLLAVPWVCAIAVPALVAGWRLESAVGRSCFDLTLPLFVPGLGNACGWILCGYFASRIGERIADARSGYLCAVIVTAGASIVWMLSWHGSQLLVAAFLLMGWEGALTWRMPALGARSGDRAKLGTAVVALILMLLQWILRGTPWPAVEATLALARDAEFSLGGLALFVLQIAVAPIALALALRLRHVAVRPLILASGAVLSMPVLATTFFDLATLDARGSPVAASIASAHHANLEPLPQ